MEQALDGADAVVFDCDGVIADSEPTSRAAWIRAVRWAGHETTPEEFHRFVGTTDRVVAEHYASLLGVPADELERLARAAFLDVLATGLDVFDDALDLLDAVRAEGRPVGVGSNSARWRLDAVLDAAGVRDRFVASVAGDEVRRPKPEPDVYTRVAEQLGLDPGRCVVIEDSPTGIAAAAAAGCRVVAVRRGMFSPDALAGADAVVEDLRPARSTSGR